MAVVTGPDRSGLAWSREEVAELRRQAADNRRPSQIALALERPVGGVLGKARALGIQLIPERSPLGVSLPDRGAIVCTEEVL